MHKLLLATVALVATLPPLWAAPQAPKKETTFDRFKDRSFAGSDDDMVYDVPDPSVDWCERFAQKPNLQHAHNCMNSFEFNPELFEATVDTVLRTLPLVVFLDTARNTPDKKYQKDYDLEQAIRAIQAQKQWNNDRHWQEALSRAMVAFHDGHLSFSPMCYRRILYRQPFYVSAYADTGEQSVLQRRSDMLYRRSPKEKKKKKKKSKKKKKKGGVKYAIHGHTGGKASARGIREMGDDDQPAGGDGGGGPPADTEQPPPPADVDQQPPPDGEGMEQQPPPQQFTAAPLMSDKEKLSHRGKRNRLAYKTKFFISGVSSRASEADKRYVGREILQMDGLEPFDHMWSYAKMRVADYKDPSSRFNHLFARMSFSRDGGWSLIPGFYTSRGKLPHRDQFKWTVRGEDGQPEHVVRDWEVIIPTYIKFKNKKEFWTKYCLVNPPVEAKVTQALTKPIMLPKKKNVPIAVQPQEAVAKSATDALVIDVLRDKRDLQFLTDKQAKLYVPKPGEAIISAPGLAFFHAPSHPTVGVLHVFTFGIESKEDAAWRTGLANIVNEIAARKMTHLIIDLSNNGGGNACLASELLSILVPNPKKPFPALRKIFWKDARMSPLMRLLVDTAIAKMDSKSNFHPSGFLSVTTKQPFKGPDFYRPARFPPVQAKGAKDKTAYSQFFRDKCYTPEDNPLKKVKLTIPPAHITTLSNGLCGSACGRVYHYLRELADVKEVVTGVVPGRPRSAAAFPATQVLDVDYILSQAKRLGLTGDDNKLVPKPFKVQASMRFPVRESYGFQHHEVPLEYRFVEAKHVIDLDKEQVLQPALIWDRVVQVLQWQPGQADGQAPPPGDEQNPPPPPPPPPSGDDQAAPGGEQE